MSRFTDVASVRAAGYTSIGDASTGYEHFVHFGFLNDGYLLDPNRIESVVFQVNPDGSKVIVSAMYILSQGMTMADAPDIAGPLTTWHDHQDLCWSLDGSGNPIVVGIRPPGGSCPPGSLFVATPPMLHVWVVDHPCGPFAGIETDGAQGPHGRPAASTSTSFWRNSRRERSRSGPFWPRVRGLSLAGAGDAGHVRGEALEDVVVELLPGQALGVGDGAVAQG